MRVLLVEPPQADPAQPYSSLAVLLAAWRHAGLDVDVEDLNVDFFNYLFEPRTIQEHLDALSRCMAKAHFRDEQERELLRRAANFGDCLASGVPKALQVLKKPELFYESGTYAWAIRFIQRALETISAPYYPGRVSLQTFKTAQSYMSAKGILSATEDENSNMFIRYCETVVRPKLMARKPDVLAVSVTFQTQLIPAWTLAAKVKQWFPEVKVVFGGATLTRIRDSLPKLPQLFRDLDACILFEGETAFPALLQAWERGETGLNAPNVVLLTKNGVEASQKIHTEDLNLSPPPDHQGLPLDQYWWPEPALLINSSRGCYYGRCAFCMISPATWGPERMGKSYRLRPTEKVIEDLIFVHKQTGAQVFNLANDILPPRALYEIGSALTEKRLLFTWDSEIRLDRGLTRRTLQTMADGGCRHLRFGFETASARVGKLMNKGTDLQVTERILADCRDVGITVSLLCQVGFPGETVDEAAETLAFLQNANDRVSFVSLTQFALERGAIVFQHPEQFGVTVAPILDEDNLSWTYRYVQSDGVDVEQTSLLFEEVEARLDQSYPDRDLFFKGGLGHAHTSLYTRRYSPETFATWNQQAQREALPLEEGFLLRTAKGMLIQPEQENSTQGWSTFTISALEIPELLATIDGSLLLVLLAGAVPSSVNTLVHWIQYLSGNRSTSDEAKQMVNTLYEAGFLLSTLKDKRAVSFV